MVLRRKRLIAVSVGSLLLFVGGAYAVQELNKAPYMPTSQMGEAVYESEWAEIVPPPTWTVQDEAAMEAAMQAYTAKQPMPQGWSIAESLGKVSARLTGAYDPSSGDVQIVVTVMDDDEDLDEARLFLDDQLLLTAARGNGLVEDRSGIAFATMTAFVPANALSFTVRAEWTGDDGLTNSHEVLLEH